MRPDNRVGKGLMIMLQDHQCFIGNRTPFLHLDPKKYDYGDDKTRWRNIWNMVWNANLKVELYNNWIPKGISKEDANLMNISVKDKELINSKWPMLYHINSCRLYLQAFYISDLSDNGLALDIGYINGSRQKKHKHLLISDVQ